MGCAGSAEEEPTPPPKAQGRVRCDYLSLFKAQFFRTNGNFKNFNFELAFLLLPKFYEFESTFLLLTSIFILFNRLHLLNKHLKNLKGSVVKLKKKRNGLKLQNNKIPLHFQNLFFNKVHQKMNTRYT
jgi:hypothetical protein